MGERNIAKQYLSRRIGYHFSYLFFSYFPFLVPQEKVVLDSKAIGASLYGKK